MSTPGIGQIVEENVIKRKGSFVFKYIYGDPEIRDWEEEDSIIIPLRGRLKIITPRKTGRVGENRGSFLRLPEAALRKIVSDLQESGFHIRSLNMTGTGGDLFHAVTSGDDIISFDLFWKLLNSGFSFQNALFTRDYIYAGLDATSRLWSNNRDLITSLGEKLADYIQFAISNLEKIILQNQRDDRIMGKERMMKYSLNEDILEEIIRRLGRGKINLSRKGKDMRRVVYSTSISEDLFLLFYGNKDLTIVPIGPVSLNGLIEYVEIIEKAGGVFLG
ncbi:hypothetical protein ACNF40_05725 [Cuniculiplasma sp. SKW4]|uniref:hypothetical protein n=1 Tax=Cuniculiplasma sp. SKW4 TaxID=3400171 RepID=UPI003FD45C65